MSKTIALRRSIFVLGHSVVLLALGVFVAPLHADVLHLNDGQSRDGDVKRTSTGYRVTLPDGTVENWSTDQVKSIELKRPAAPTTAPTDGTASSLDPATASRLASFRRSVDSVTDPKIALDRYAKFIEQNKNTPLAAEAANDVAMWQDRLDRNLTKAGTKWITADERAAMNGKAMESANEARQLLKTGRLQDAGVALDKALADDPTNVTALYLRGVLAYRTDKIPVAKQSFESVKSSVPNHGPTLNNIGVVLWRQNQFAPALASLDLAMQSTPQDQIVLNNVAEALHALPEKLRDGTVAQKAARRFTDLDTQLQQKLAADGWFRWGATWVTQTQLDQFKLQEKEVTEKLDKMAGDFDAVQSRIRQIDSDIEANARSMRRYEGGRFVVDGNGNAVRLPLPQVYYDLSNDNRRLESQRQLELARLEDLRTTAARIKQQGPQPRFTGVLRLISEEGAPVLLPTVTTADTTPATAPAGK